MQWERLDARGLGMKRFVQACGLALILTGCSTGVVPAGPQTYMISTTEVGLTNGGRAKAAAYQKADAWCRQRGLVMVPMTVDQHPARPFGRYGGAELKFKALKPGDPEISTIKVVERMDD